jgi:hypothetical protein
MSKFPQEHTTAVTLTVDRDVVPSLIIALAQETFRLLVWPPLASAPARGRH